MQTKLTRAAIDKLESPTTNYILVWDTELPNFGLRITAAGTRAFFVQRRMEGRDKRITIGRYGVFTPEQARNEARKLLGKIAAGIDPLAERARKIAHGKTLAEAFTDFLSARRNLKPKTVADMRNAMRDLAWGEKRITAITPDAVERRHAELGERSHARANLTMRYLRAILNFAAEKYADADGRPVLAANPVRRLSKARAWYRVERRRTLLREHELRPWMQTVLALNSPEARDYFLLLLMTGLRRSEAFDLRWGNVDMKARTLTVPDAKNRKNHTLPLSDYLSDLLDHRKQSARSEYVFASERGRLQNLRYALAEVSRAAGVKFTPHDLRRTFATVADKLDIPAYALKALLNHANMADVTAGYVVHDVERLRKPMQRITDYFLAAGGVRKSAEVLDLSQARSA